MGEQVLGADVGGTYTDFLVVDRENTGIRIAKVLTTPGNQAQGFLEDRGGNNCVLWRVCIDPKRDCKHVNLVHEEGAQPG